MWIKISQSSHKRYPHCAQWTVERVPQKSQVMGNARNIYTRMTGKPCVNFHTRSAYYPPTFFRRRRPTAHRHFCLPFECPIILEHPRISCVCESAKYIQTARAPVVPRRHIPRVGGLLSRAAAASQPPSVAYIPQSLRTDTTALSACTRGHTSTTGRSTWRGC